VDVEISQHKEGKPKIREEVFWCHRVDSVVDGVGGVGIDNPERVEGGAKKRFICGDVEGENIIHPLKPGKHRIIGKKRNMNVGGHTWLPNRGEKGLETVKRGKVGLIDRWILQKDYRGVGGRFLERLLSLGRNQAPYIGIFPQP